jgi:putative Ig domain-containing protein
VIMALLPKAVDVLPAEAKPDSEQRPLTITTPDVLPEAIAGRPYVVALAATGGDGPLRWAVDGAIPAGLTFDQGSGQLRGTPKAGIPQPASLVLRVSDGTERASRTTQLVVYQSDHPLTLPSRYLPGLPPIPWRAWLEHGFGFLVLVLVHSVGMNALASLERWSTGSIDAGPEAQTQVRTLRRRFAVYRFLTRLATVSAMAVLALWLRQRG